MIQRIVVSGYEAANVGSDNEHAPLVGRGHNQCDDATMQDRQAGCSSWRLDIASRWTVPSWDIFLWRLLIKCKQCYNNTRMLIPEQRHCQHVTVLVFVRWPCNVCAWQCHFKHQRL